MKRGMWRLEHSKLIVGCSELGKRHEHRNEMDKQHVRIHVQGLNSMKEGK